MGYYEVVICGGFLLVCMGLLILCCLGMVRVMIKENDVEMVGVYKEGKVVVMFGS